MTKTFVTTVPQPAHKLISRMTDAELEQYAARLVDGGIFVGTPGLSSDGVDTQSEAATP